MSLLEVNSVSKVFGGVRANQDISLNAPEGSMIGLIGPNGAGKPTIILKSSVDRYEALISI